MRVAWSAGSSANSIVTAQATIIVNMKTRWSKSNGTNRTRAATVGGSMTTKKYVASRLRTEARTRPSTPASAAMSSPSVRS